MSEPPAVRVSDAERERAVAVLREHCVDGRLTLEEFSQRVDESYAAQTTAELERVTRELPAITERRQKRLRRFAVSVFGDVERRGRMALGRFAFVLSVFGNVDFDLRSAELRKAELTVVVFCFFGNADVYVPEGAEVELLPVILFGHARDTGHQPPSRPEAPVVRVRAFGLFGTIDVWRVPPGAHGTFRDLVKLARRRQTELPA